VLDASGNARNGAYTAVTLGAAGVGDGRTSASFDGSTSVANIFGASLATAFNGAEGTAAIWLRVSSAGVWTDATVRRCVIGQVDANNRIDILRSAANNTIQFFYRAGAVSSSVNAGSQSSTGWIHAALTWNKAADQVKAYLNGAQAGATQTGLGVWAGTFAATTTCIGASSTAPATVWSGTLAHTALWDRALTLAEIASLATF
jgi:hypothetical protein